MFNILKWNLLKANDNHYFSSGQISEFGLEKESIICIICYS